jgi:hypothetical protein
MPGSRLRRARGLQGPAMEHAAWTPPTPSPLLHTHLDASEGDEQPQNVVGALENLHRNNAIEGEPGKGDGGVGGGVEERGRQEGRGHTQKRGAANNHGKLKTKQKRGQALAGHW